MKKPYINILSELTDTLTKCIYKSLWRVDVNWRQFLLIHRINASIEYWNLKNMTWRDIQPDWFRLDVPPCQHYWHVVRPVNSQASIQAMGSVAHRRSQAIPVITCHQPEDVINQVQMVAPYCDLFLNQLRINSFLHSTRHRWHNLPILVTSTEGQSYLGTPTRERFVLNQASLINLFTVLEIPAKVSFGIENHVGSLNL